MLYLDQITTACTVRRYTALQYRALNHYNKPKTYFTFHELFVIPKICCYLLPRNSNLNKLLQATKLHTVVSS